MDTNQTVIQKAAAYIKKASRHKFISPEIHHKKYSKDTNSSPSRYRRQKIQFMPDEYSDIEDSKNESKQIQKTKNSAEIHQLQKGRQFSPH